MGRKLLEESRKTVAQEGGGTKVESPLPEVQTFQCGKGLGFRVYPGEEAGSSVEDGKTPPRGDFLGTINWGRRYI
jgi:hypothetical protein